MADSRKPVESASAAPGEKRSAAPPRRLAKASESGDPYIQKLLADRYTAEQNAAMAAAAADQSEADREAHEGHVAARTRQLNDLGFE